MALDPNELFSSNNRGGHLRYEPRKSRTAKFGSGTALLKAGCPVAYDTGLGGQWVPLAAAGAEGENIIRGFVWPENIQLVNGSEVLGTVMVEGDVHAADVLRFASNSGDTEYAGPLIVTTIQLTAALSTAALQDKGIFVEGLAGLPK